MSEKIKKAYKLFNREDLIDDRYERDLDSNIQVFLTTKQMINYMDLQQKVEQLEKELKEANDSISWWSNRFKAVERDNKQLENIIKEAINKLKEHKYDLDYEPWSIYKIKGSILFELTETLNKGSE